MKKQTFIYDVRYYFIMITIKELNKITRKAYHTGITLGFESSLKAFYCSKHGFQNAVKLEISRKDCFGFGNEFHAKCPICQKQLIEVKHTCQTCKFFKTTCFDFDTTSEVLKPCTCYNWKGLR